LDKGAWNIGEVELKIVRCLVALLNDYLKDVVVEID
jgi:hypothetical protein